jgi:hypothetical protein
LKFSNNFSTGEFAFQLRTRPEKLSFVSLKIRAGDSEKLDFPDFLTKNTVINVSICFPIAARN